MWMEWCGVVALDKDRMMEVAGDPVNISAHSQ